MTVGNQPTQESLNNDLSQLAVQFRNICTGIQQFFEQVNDLGTSGLTALGFSSADATAFVNDTSLLNTPVGVYFGTATQATEFDFDNALSGVWDLQ